jgi:tryptophan 2,3-dioxygenase
LLPPGRRDADEIARLRTSAQLHFGIDDYLLQEDANRVITLFCHVHIALHRMTEQLALLETMSPKAYQAIRLRLGNGSGQESPVFALYGAVDQLHVVVAKFLEELESAQNH